MDSREAAIKNLALVMAILRNSRRKTTAISGRADSRLCGGRSHIKSMGYEAGSRSVHSPDQAGSGRSGPAGPAKQGRKPSRCAAFWPYGMLNELLTQSGQSFAVLFLAGGP